MAITQRFRIDYAEKVSHSPIGKGWRPGQTLEGVRVRATPIPATNEADSPGIYVPTPNGVIGFAVYGPKSAVLTPGTNIVLSIETG